MLQTRTGPSTRSSRIKPWISLSLAIAALPLALAGRAPAQERPAETLQKVNESVQALIQKVSPSVVQILVTGYGVVDESEHGSTGLVIGRQRAIGSGFVLDASGYIITNAHVVSGAQRVQVVLPSPGADASPRGALIARGTVVPAQIVGVTREIDLALLKVDAANLRPLPIAEYRDLRQGELVFAFGSPQGLRNSVTLGVVSAAARQPDPDSPLVYIQTDAPINPGNSGGPLVNVKGEVVGVNTFILTQSGGNEGLGFAIPCAILKVAYNQLRKYGHLHRSEIGIGMQTITPTLASALGLLRNTGVIISDVRPGSPAEAAGLRVQDVLLSVDGRPADSLPYVAFLFVSRDAGEKVHLEIQRGTNQIAFDVPLVVQRHEMDQLTALADPSKNLVRPLGVVGLEIDNKIAVLLPALRDPYGILVVARAANTGADVPLATGDVIRTLNGQPMTTLERLRQALANLQAGANVALQIQRDERLLYIAYTFEQP